MPLTQQRCNLSKAVEDQTPKEDITKPDLKSGIMQEHNTQRVNKIEEKANKEMNRQNHMPATPENLPLLPKLPPMFQGPELAAMPPSEVTPMMVMIMLMIMLGVIVSQWRDACMVARAPEREK